MFHIASLLIDLIAPKKCYSCKSEGHFLCPLCMKDLEFYAPFCYVCKQKSDNFYVHQSCRKGVYYDQMIVLTHYKQTPIKALLHDGKFYKKFAVYDDFISSLADVFQKNQDISPDTLVTFPPLHILRHLKRGYNQSQYIAKHFSKLLEISCFSLLSKTKHTEHQSHLSKKEREKNLSDIFILRTKYTQFIREKTVIIVDDVVSTGTTLNECAKVLKLAGAKKIICLTIASD